MLNSGQKRVLRPTHMVKERGSDVVKVTKEGEEAAPQLVVPHLVRRQSNKSLVGIMLTQTRNLYLAEKQLVGRVRFTLIL